MEKQRRTFISYSRANKDFAIKLAKELKSEGFQVWLDMLDIPPGSRWDVEVEKALEECEIFMIIMTPASIASENVRDEIGYAIDNGKRFLPVLLENCTVPLRLRRFQYVDFTNKNFDDGVESAKELLRNLIAQVTIPREELAADTQAQSSQAEAERKAKEEAERLATQKAEEERLAKAKVEAERLAAQKTEEKRIAQAKAEEKRLAKAKAEADKKEEAKRLAAQNAEEERLAKAEAERLAAKKAEEESAAQARAEADRLAKEEADRLAKEEAARLAAQKAEAGQQYSRVDSPSSQGLETKRPAARKSRTPLFLGIGAGVLAICAVFAFAAANIFTQSKDPGATNAALVATAPSTEVANQGSISVSGASTPTVVMEEVVVSPTQTAGPVLLSSAEVENTIAGNSYKTIRDIAGQEYSDDAINVFIENSTPVPVKLNLSKRVAIRQGWCATTEEILQDNLAFINITFKFDGEIVPDENSFDEYFMDQDGWACYRKWIMIDKWKSGNYFIYQEMDITQAINDGQDNYDPFTSQVTWSVTLP